MAKASALSIITLEKQLATLEKKIIQTKSKKIAQLEKAIVKQKKDIEKLKLKLTTEKIRLKSAKTATKKQSIRGKQKTLKTTINDKTAALADLKTALIDAKIDYKNSLELQKAKAKAIKEAAKPKRKKKTLGKKVKAKKIDKKTPVPVAFLGIDTNKPVEPVIEQKIEPKEENVLSKIPEEKPETTTPIETSTPTPIVRQESGSPLAEMEPIETHDTTKPEL